MNKLLPKIVLAFAGLLALAVALRGLTAPVTLGTGLGYGMTDVDAVNEVRAQYGGFFLAVAVACGLSLFNVIPPRATLLLLAIVFGGVLTGRLVSLFADGGWGAFGPTIKVLFAVDAVGLAAATAALVWLKSTGSRPDGTPGQTS